MATPEISDDSPGIQLFQEFDGLYDLIASQVGGLTESQLDFDSTRWAWSEWSIRRQLSHMGSLVYRWLLVRLGDSLFPDGDHGIADVDGLAQSEFDRRMDETRYWDAPVIRDKLSVGLDLVISVLGERSVGFLRSHTFEQHFSPHWDVMLKAHPTGVSVYDHDKTKGTMTLEACFRHIYFEETTHLFNIQRLKRAQGLSTVIDLPRVGYWVAEGWDISEP